jgi:hypothetical protein
MSFRGGGRGRGGPTGANRGGNSIEDFNFAKKFLTTLLSEQDVVDGNSQSVLQPKC